MTKLCLSRAQLLARMKSYAVGFRRHGVQQGDRVCVHVNNNVENYAAMYGCILAGATIVMAKTSLTERKLAWLQNGLLRNKITDKNAAVTALERGKRSGAQEMKAPL
ncbi:hypothetical protein HPB48_001592 [Haemaphysalis longicornis]|uniref:AMP-dependent synthetase/ligase domain-containing protein n=1 Tax=Haemaphysalis longicornis TaxID=44386 RepID=A0A9J6GBV7_HAELO|nr:hypothetical protein HPB48_001592 [Haemaphysalis longicornis]